METNTTETATAGHDSIEKPLKDLTAESIAKFNELAPEPKPGDKIAKRDIDATIKQVVQYCKDFTIGSGIDAAEKLKLGKTILTKVVKYRTGIEKKRTEIKEPAVKFGKSIDEEAKRLQALLAPAEAAMKDKVGAAENAAKKAKEDRALLRRTQLIETGFQFDGQLWAIGREMVIPSKLDEATDDEFATIIDNGKAEAERLIEEHAQLQALKDAAEQSVEVPAGDSHAAHVTEAIANTIAAGEPIAKTGEAKPIKWFMDRIGKEIMAYSSEYFTGPMVVKDSSNAVFLAEIAQSQQGYYFEDIGGDKPAEQIAPSDKNASTDSQAGAIIKIAGYKEGYEKAIEDVLLVLKDPEKVTRQTLVERVNYLLDIHKKTIFY